MGRSPVQDRARTTIGRTLAVSLVLVTLVPFLPLAVLTFRAYQRDVAALEVEIRSTNRQIALLAARFLDGLVRQVRADMTMALTGRVHWTSDPFPPSLAGVRWEVLDGDGIVVASELSPERTGRPADYESLAPPTLGGGGPGLAVADRLTAGFPPTSVLVQRVAPDRVLAAVLDPEGLRRQVATLAPGLDRHVYASDRNGRLLFYSDPQVTRHGENLGANPPVRLFVEGGAGELRFRSVVSGKERLGFVQPVAGTAWGVIVSADIASSVLAVRDRYLALALSIAFAALTALGILMWSSRRLTRPLAEIRAALRHWRAERPGPITIAEGSPQIAEYHDLVAALDDLSRRLAAAEAELVQAAKASLTGQIASGIAHEIGTPLNVISGNAQYALRKLPDGDPRRELLHGIVRQSERISAIVKRFLEFARSPQARLGAVDLGDLAAGVVELVPGINARVDVRLERAPGVPLVQGDPKLLEHALMNLVVNACQAMPGGGTLTLRVAQLAGETDAAGWVACTVADTGAGIVPENLPRVFEPFFTTKPLGQGTGLGLAIVDRIVRQHGGDVRVASDPGVGSVFTVRLRPAAADAAGARRG